MRIQIRTLLAASAAAVFATGSAGAAMASAERTTRDCVVDAVSGGERCFDDYRAAIAYATGGAITDAPLSAHRAATDPAFRTKVADLSARRARALTTGAVRANAAIEDSSVIGATLFTGTNYTGDSETIRIPKPCVKDGWYDYYYVLGTVGRNSESVQPWANCWIWLHEGDSFDSPRQGPYKTDTPDLGDWKRRAVLMGLS